MQCFQILGEISLTGDQREIPDDLLPLEMFTCMVYTNSKTNNLGPKIGVWGPILTRIGAHCEHILL